MAHGPWWFTPSTGFSVRAALVGIVALAAALLPASRPAHAQPDPLLKGQPACPQVPPVGGCIDFRSTNPPPDVVRSVNLNAPGPGSALVLVNGSGFCVNEVGEHVNHAHFVTQIVADPDATPTHKGAGGLHFFPSLPRGNDQHGASVPINLSSSRVFPVPSAGLRRYYLKLDVVALPTGVRCVFYSTTMSVLFIPQ
jgi:hypothetical protein